VRRAIVSSHLPGLRLLLCCSALSGAQPAAADWFLDGAAGYTFDDNVPNALKEQDRLSDHALNAALRAGSSLQLRPDTSLTLALIAEQILYMRYSGLTNLAAGGQARMRHKFGLGADATWAALSGQAVYHNAHYDYRDGWQYDASLTLGKRLSDRWSVQGSVRYDRFEADHLQATILPGYSTAAYDISGWTFGARAAFALTESDLLSIGYAWRNGTVTAVTPRDREVLEYSSALARDTVFGTTPRRVAYRIDGETDLLSVGWSHTLNPRSAVTLSYVYRRTQAPDDLGEYYSNLVGLNLGYAW
jgi:long-subunit fatty acid transport protein